MRHRFRRPCRVNLLPVFLGWILIALAAPVHAAGDEETVARNFLKYLRSDKTILSSEVLQGSLLDTALPPVTAGHLFHLDGGGYLLISPDRSISPVKAYSLGSDFAALPESYRKSLLAELELRTRVAPETAGRIPLDSGTTETAARWDFLLGFEAARMPLAYMPGTHLLETQWNQTYPYNKFLPAVGGQTVVTGCVNVAVAQVMRYHRHPAASQGVVSYRWDGPPEQTLKTILYRGYNWDNMPAAADSTTPDYQADEVALLIRDIGIANLTDFDIDGSSTSLNSGMLIENFGYSTALSELSNADFGTFLSTLKGEIDAGRPVLLTLPSHMTVADGYSADDSGRKVHVNLGWGGVDDEFYFLDQPIHAGDYIFPVSAGALEIHYNIKPCSTAAGDCAVNREAGDEIDDLAIGGNFNRPGDTDLYELYLKGPTTIRGTRGYGNLGFFMSIVRLSDGSEVFPAPDPGVPGTAGTDFAAGSLTAGKYRVRVSLCDGESYCYSPHTGCDHYAVTLASGTLTAQEKLAADQALERAPVIGSALPDLILTTNSGTRKIRIDARDENGDAVTLNVQNSNPAAVGASLNGSILELTPTAAAKASSRISLAASANGRTAERTFTVMTDSVDTAFGHSFSVNGTFGGQNDVKTHRALLDGACTISGYNGFSNQAFFSSVLDAEGHVVVAPDDSSIGRTFNRGIHLLKASLSQNPGGAGSYYPYETGSGDRYTLTVSCPGADVSTPAIAGLLGIDLSGANLPFEKPGDVDGDGSVMLGDAVRVLQMLSGGDMTGKTMAPGSDVDGNQRIGPAEALFILQSEAGLRSP